MKIAILSDIHANLYALREVISFLRQQNIRKLFVLGDIIGYYYQPKEVLELLEQFDTTYVRGNHEEMLAEAILDSNKRMFIISKYGHGIELAIETLSLKNISFLTNLPTNVTVKINKLKMLLCHGSPWNTNFYLYPDAPQELIDKFGVYQVDFIFYGHTHYPVVFSAKGTKIINPGSVGQSRIMGGIANFGILDTLSKEYVQQAIPYEIKEILEDIAKKDSNISYLQTILTRNNVKI
jgi:putative phosphoesterase